ncbi:hypothetical protein NEDG_00905 [Nematocida displodere]|uniref:Uncharacterized protein n=1 Tax=Nematocida displodere TaxID=1805483 RepID=A0A177EF66_9MICR|nr:hypothetical protein NEDG_00905 [Nematocida displodere]
MNITPNLNYKYFYFSHKNSLEMLTFTRTLMAVVSLAMVAWKGAMAVPNGFDSEDLTSDQSYETAYETSDDYFYDATPILNITLHHNDETLAFFKHVGASLETEMREGKECVLQRQAEPKTINISTCTPQDIPEKIDHRLEFEDLTIMVMSTHSEKSLYVIQDSKLSLLGKLFKAFGVLNARHLTLKQIGGAVSDRHNMLSAPPTILNIKSLRIHDVNILGINWLVAATELHTNKLVLELEDFPGATNLNFLAKLTHSATLLELRLINMPSLAKLDCALLHQGGIKNKLVLRRLSPSFKLTPKDSTAILEKKWQEIECDLGVWAAMPQPPNSNFAIDRLVLNSASEQIALLKQEGKEAAPTPNTVAHLVINFTEDHYLLTTPTLHLIFGWVGTCLTALKTISINSVELDKATQTYLAEQSLRFKTLPLLSKLTIEEHAYTLNNKPSTVGNISEEIWDGKRITRSTPV